MKICLPNEICKTIFSFSQQLKMNENAIIKEMMENKTKIIKKKK